ncbi:DUF4169 family protein [Roseibium aggregatum]|uniref:DUF4169 family protein n=1 Tax=Roseibium aggregatum TaxID=187304 RepID=UPI001A8E40AF|nr:DUF4169 family protein [Roseibium aggregatum]MBN8181936.1 DUF4169 family protein [Roseibium aggregatum]UES43806.1 DUF4169 family protein [Roseibium aggregatum]
MSAEIINLRMVRKQKNRQVKEKTAEDNRRKYGRSKAEREAARQRRETLETHVDGHLLEKPDVPDAEPSDKATTDADKTEAELSGPGSSGDRS